MIMRVQKLVYEAVADLRRRAEGAMPPSLREEKAINKVHKLLLEGAKIIN